MNERVFNGICIAIFVIQLLLCFRGKKAWLRLLPASAVLILAAGSYAVYWLGSSHNWGWLIAAALSLRSLIAVAAGWGTYGLYRLAAKYLGKNKA